MTDDKPTYGSELTDADVKAVMTALGVTREQVLALGNDTQESYTFTRQYLGRTEHGHALSGVETTTEIEYHKERGQL